jgi:hypothetical protein
MSSLPSPYLAEEVVIHERESALINAQSAEA